MCKSLGKFFLMSSPSKCLSLNRGASNARRCYIIVGRQCFWKEDVFCRSSCPKGASPFWNGDSFFLEHVMQDDLSSLSLLYFAFVIGVTVRVSGCTLGEQWKGVLYLQKKRFVRTNGLYFLQGANVPCRLFCYLAFEFCQRLLTFASLLSNSQIIWVLWTLIIILSLWLWFCWWCCRTDSFIIWVICFVQNFL